MRILLVGQVSDEEAQSSSELSVVNHVIKADARREKALWEYKSKPDERDLIDACLLMHITLSFIVSARLTGRDIKSLEDCNSLALDRGARDCEKDL